jgi:sortase A
MMRRSLRALGAVMVAGGLLILAWAVLVWQWEDPFPAVYTKWKQHQLAQSYDRLLAQYRSPPLKRGASLAVEIRGVRHAAAAYRSGTHRGQAIGRIVIGRIGVKMILVDGTDHDSLMKGPGRDLRTFMPGQNRLVYIAGHRTTYLAPFSHIDQIRPGDYIELDMPYGRFTYRAYMHRVVPADDLAVLKSPKHELLELQACHPRFFATHRYIVYAKLVSVRPRGSSRPFAPATMAAARG